MGAEKGYFTQETPQPRMQWYLVGRAAAGLVTAAERSGIDSKDLVFIGGFSSYMHLRSVVGNLAVTHWRGTKDVDLIVFERGGGKRLVKGIERRGNYERADIKFKKSHFVDKDSFEVVFPPQGVVDLDSRTVDLDVYSPSNGQGFVRMNERQIGKYPEYFLSEQVQTYTIADNGRLVEVSVPSVADCMILKLDIVAYSKTGLRDKDKSDLLTLLMVAEAKGLDSMALIRKVFSFIGAKVEAKTASEMLSTIDMINSKKRRALKKQGTVLYEPSQDYVAAIREFLKKKASNHF